MPSTNASPATRTPPRRSNWTVDIDHEVDRQQAGRPSVRSSMIFGRSDRSRSTSAPTGPPGVRSRRRQRILFAGTAGAAAATPSDPSTAAARRGFARPSARRQSRSRSAANAKRPNTSAHAEHHRAPACDATARTAPIPTPENHIPVVDAAEVEPFLDASVSASRSFNLKRPPAAPTARRRSPDSASLRTAWSRLRSRRRKPP